MSPRRRLFTLSAGEDTDLAGESFLLYFILFFYFKKILDPTLSYLEYKERITDAVSLKCTASAK